MISDSETADTTAPPRPCTARAADQQPLRVRHAAGERGQREERDAEEKQLAMAVQIAQPAAEQQEAAEGQHVRVDDPDQRGFRRSRDPRIDGSATFTIVVSSTIISTPRHSTQGKPAFALVERHCAHMRIRHRAPDSAR